MLNLRKIFFYFFCLLYLVICPSLLFYSLGYQLQPDSNKTVVETGLISLATNPAGGKVFLGHESLGHVTPTIIRGILPGHYFIQIVLKDHRIWEKNIPVEAQKASVFERILLIPEKIPYRELAAGPFDDLLPVAQNRFLVLQNGPHLDDTFIYNRKDGKVSPLFAGPEFKDQKIKHIYTMPDSSLMFVEVASPPPHRFFEIELLNEKIKWTEVTDLFPQNPVSIKWQAQNDQDIFVYESDGSVTRVNLQDEAIFPRLIENLHGFGLHERSILALSNDNTFSRRNFKGQPMENYRDDPNLMKSLFAVVGFIDVKVLSRNLILFLGDKGELFSSRLPYRFVDEGVRGLEFHAPSNRVLLWTKDKIGILDFNQTTESKGLLEQGPELIWLFKNGISIDQAFWAYDGAYIVFNNAGKVNLLESQTFGKPSVEELLEVKPDSAIAYDEESGTIYFMDRTTGNLCATPLIEKNNIFEIPSLNEKEEKKKYQIEEP